MTPNHGYDPTDEQIRQQGGQQPPNQQPPQGGQQPQNQQPQNQQPPNQQPQNQQPQNQQPSQGGPAQPPQQAPPQLGQQPPQGIQQPQFQQPQQGQQFGQPFGQAQQPLVGAHGPPQQQAVQPPVGGSQQPPGQQQPPMQPQLGQPSSRQMLLKPARVNEILTEDVVTAEPDAPVQSVVAKMAENDVGSVVVVEEDRPVGILTDRTIAMALREMPDVAQHAAGELIQGEVVTGDPSMTIFDALERMRTNSIRRLPIVDDNGALRGIVTLDDALVLFGGAFGQVAETVESQSPRL
ncbi:CBS domain-containing protein [Haloarcula marina]|uniref:CBS domain-containing protein n=1 Tax=Haloarcula marina TaxID=2961574 RepID=UPI0020B6537F|nr:CBS domain-containing protein [Halomicroarcula marina]